QRREPAERGAGQVAGGGGARGGSGRADPRGRRRGGGGKLLGHGPTPRRGAGWGGGLHRPWEKNWDGGTRSWAGPRAKWRRNVARADDRRGHHDTRDRRSARARRVMKKVIGVFCFLVAIYACLMAADPGAQSWTNHFNLLRRIGMYGILSVGAGILIISGG